MTTPATEGWTVQQAMLQRVADALGPGLLPRMAFVGGCTTGLLVTDAISLEAVRFTDDVDLIVHVLGQGRWYQLQRELAGRGFRTSPEDDVICRTRLRDGHAGDLIVDFMPDDATILGFTNRWYADALRVADEYVLPGGTVIRVVSPAYFIGTKLEAFRGRGNNDPLGSRDVEDILYVVDGRDSLGDEITVAPEALRADIAAGLGDLMRHRDFDYAVQAAARNNRQREDLIFARLHALTALNR